MKNDMYPILPLSLRIKRRNRILRKIVICAILFFAFLFIILVFGEVLFSVPEKYAVTKSLIYLLVLLLPFAITGVPVKLIDKSWSGTVLAVDVKESVGSYKRSLGKYGIYTKHDLVLKIQKDDGREIEYTALSLGVKYKPSQEFSEVGKIEYHTSEYRVGDRVHKYYGFKYLYISNRNDQDGKPCIVCGSNNNIEHSRCWSCGSEMIE